MEQIEEKTLQTVFSAALAMLSAYFGIVAIPIAVLIVAMVIDYSTGMAAAWKQAYLSSKKGIYGILKKVSYLALICVGMLVDWLIYCGLQTVNVQIGYTFFFGVLVTIWLIINELISILENLERLDVPMPKFLVKVIKRLKITAENVGESEDNKDE